MSTSDLKSDNIERTKIILSDLTTHLSESMTETSKIVDESMRQLSERSNASLKPIAESMHRQLEEIKENAYILSEIFNKSWADSFSHIFAKIKKNLDRFKIDEALAMKLLKKYKLFLTPSLDIRLAMHIANIGRKRGNHRAEINRLLRMYFYQENYSNLELLINNWNHNVLFRPRMKIFRDCLAVIRGAGKIFNPSNVVLPALLGQIDGIRQCYMEKKGYIYKKGKWMDSKGRIEGWKDIYRLATKGNKYMAAAYEIFSDILFHGCLIIS